MLHPTHELEPPANPARFSLSTPGSLDESNAIRLLTCREADGLSCDHAILSNFEKTVQGGLKLLIPFGLDVAVAQFAHDLGDLDCAMCHFILLRFLGGQSMMFQLRVAGACFGAFSRASLASDGRSGLLGVIDLP